MSNQKKIYKRSCLNCGKEFETDKKGNKFCSSECKDKYYNVEVECTYCGKHYKIERTRYNRYLNGRPKKLYCSLDCTYSDKTQQLVTKRCLNCHEIFSTKNRNQKCCSKKCKEHYDKKPNNIKRITICPSCGKMFISKNKRQIYCNKKCRNLNQKRRETVKCATCGKEIEKKYSEITNKKVYYCSSYCLNHRMWSEDDVEILKTYYYLVPVNELLKLLDNKYTKEQIRSKVNNARLTHSIAWTNDEDGIIMNDYPSLSYEELLKKLPGRTLDGIINRARRLGVVRDFTLERYYSVEDDEYIKKYFLKKNIDEMAQHLNRSPIGIVQHAYRLGLRNPRIRKSNAFTGMSSYIRTRLYAWRNNYIKEHHNTCEITGLKDNVVLHHIKSLNTILEEAFVLTNIAIKDNFSDYTHDEMHQIFDAFFNLQEENKLYICIHKTIHKEFHVEYGYGNNTKEQWDEFLKKKGY